MKKIIEVTDLKKEYKVRTAGNERLIDKVLLKRNYTIKKAVDNISFSVEEGEMVGYLGLNGAGKSTTVKMLVGILAPSAGTVSVLGWDPLYDRKKCSKYTATIFGQKNQLWWDLPVWDSLELVKYLYNIPNSTFLDNYHYLDKFLEISEIKSIPVRQLSLGQKMRANLCFAFLHNPKIIFLDEPTIGLDLLTKQQVHDCVKEMNSQKGTTMILTTHDVSDIENLCKRVLLIDQGKIVFDDSLNNLKNEFVSDSGIYIKFERESDTEKIKKTLMKNSIVYEKQNDLEYILHVNKEDFWKSDVFYCINRNFKINSIVPVNEDLNNVLTKVYESMEK